MLLTLPIEPLPCPRPRVGRHGAYYPARYRKWKVKFRKLVLAAFPDVPIRGPVTAVILLFARRPRKTRLAWPKPDVDNYAKSVMDGCNGVVWEDDSQVVTLRVHKAWSEVPRIELQVYALDTVLAPPAGRGTT